MQRLINGLLALGLALPLAGCDGQPDAIEGTSSEIIGGDLVPDDGYPTVGLVITVANISSNGMPATRAPLTLCTGTLISPTAVLLAAHCVDKMMIAPALPQGVTIQGELEFKFSFGNSSREYIQRTPTGVTLIEKPSLLAVASAEQMPINALGIFQRPGQMDDIAVLHLAHPVKGRPVQLLATPDVVAALQTGSTHAVAGYGMTSNVPGDFNGDGMEDPPEASGGTLHSGISKLDTIGQWEIIAGDMDPQQACHGDSGGPIFVDESTSLQLGIASRINAFPIPGQPPPTCTPGLLYTRVDAYQAWIQQHVPDVGQATEPCAPGDTDPSCPPSSGGGGADAGGPGPGAPDGGVDNPGDGDQTGGCGCTVARGSSPGGSLLGLLLVGMALVFLRRRR